MIRGQAANSVSWMRFLRAPFVDVRHKRSTKGNSVIVLDGIRGLAVLVVLASHSRAFGMFGQGSLGVFLFFFLSGFVLTLPYSTNTARRMNLGDLAVFAKNRVLRILPLHWILTLAMMVLLKQEWSWYLWNISFIKGWNHLWSVAEEMRFYVLFPAVMAVVSLLPRLWLKIALLALLTIVAFDHMGLHTIDLMDGRRVKFYFYMFTGGMLTCFLSQLAEGTKAAEWKGAAVVLQFVPICCLCLMFLSSSTAVELLWRPLFPSIPEGMKFNGWYFPGGWMLLFMAFFFSLVTLRRGPAYRLLTGYPLRHIGLLSYSIYLSHMVIMYFFEERGLHGEFLFLAVFAVSYLLALLTYACIEKPFLSLKKRRFLSFVGN